MTGLNRVLPMLAVLLLAAVAAAYLRARGDVRSPGERLGSAVDLEGSLEPLRSEFNRRRGRPRLLTVVSPACPVCLEGMEAIQRELLASETDLAVLVVWMEALPFDITRNPRRRIELLESDPRVAQFSDGLQVVGRALGDALDWPTGSVAWDVYLFYPPEATWAESLPPPSAWFHQRQEADPARYRTGPELARELREQALVVSARP